MNTKKINEFEYILIFKKIKQLSLFLNTFFNIYNNFFK